MMCRSDLDTGSLEVLRRPTKDPETEGDSGDPAEGSEAASNAS